MLATLPLQDAVPFGKSAFRMIPSGIYLQVASTLISCAKDTDPGVMHFEIDCEEFTDAAGNLYFVSVTGEYYYNTTYEMWGFDDHVSGATLFLVECDTYNKEGNPVPNDFSEDKLWRELVQK